MADVSPLFQEGVAHHRAGRMAEAQQAYEQTLLANPRHAAALHLLGLMALDQNQLAKAIEYLGAAVGLEETQASAKLKLAEAYQRSGQPGPAIFWYREALKLDPGQTAALSSLGELLDSQGDMCGAAECFEQALRVDPVSANLHFQLGNLRDRQGELDAAAHHYRRTLELKLDHAEALIFLGQVLRRQGKQAEVRTLFEQMARLQPMSSTVETCLAMCLEEEGKHDLALAHFRRAAELAPQAAEGFYNLAIAHRDANRPLEALKSFDQALALDPKFTNALIGKARIFIESSRPDEAVAACRDLLAIEPNSAIAQGHLGIAMLSQADIAGALDAYRRTMELEPNLTANHSNYVYTLNFLPGVSDEQLFQEHLAWARRHAEHWTAQAPAHTNDRSPERRLRIGYVSPHFRTHAVSTFSEPLIAAHDHGPFEIFLYYDQPRVDEVTQRFRGMADHFRHQPGISDDALVNLVRQEQIDILIDLAGHIGLNRLPVFARRPAPVQVTYLGYQNTTGMSAMDYRLTDALADPAGLTDRFYTEKLVRLARSFFCYLPPDPSPDVSPLPAQARDWITFGSFNHLQKITPEAIELWGKILAELPDSRLLVLGYPDGVFERRLRTAMGRFGIGGDRLHVAQKRPRYDYMKLFHEVDIALDSFPFNGHTTVCDGLWMGVPSVMLQGGRYATRFGGSTPANLGLDDWIAKSEDDYRQIALRMAADTTSLAALRGELRERMRRSPLLDYAGFARNVEAAYRQMWRAWCASTTS